ncbi:MAG TPA: hypothetical protein VE282_05000, partial [Gemmatimonadales bacterium]|nr:hypothetical protein [Gemmatimonadales bacterium]
APTWSSCGMIVGGRESFRASILHNADQQIARFLSDWRKVNPAIGRSDGRAVGQRGGPASHPERSEGSPRPTFWHRSLTGRPADFSLRSK